MSFWIRERSSWVTPPSAAAASSSCRIRVARQPGSHSFPRWYGYAASTGLLLAVTMSPAGGL